MRTELPKQAALARLFSPQVIRGLARHDCSASFSRLAVESGMQDVISGEETLGQFFDLAFKRSKEVEYRHEYVYKAVITEKILLGIHNLRTASMLTEVRANRCKADIVVLNGTAAVYEIKSERDNLIKLEKQISAYRDIFAQVNVITASKHTDAVLRVVPEDVGVLTLSGRSQISTIRMAKTDPNRVLPSQIFESLQIREAKKVANLLGIDVPDLPNTKIHAALKEMFSALEPSDVHAAMVSVMKTTRSLNSLSWLIDSLPESLHAAALFLKLSKQDQEGLILAVNTEVRDVLKWS